MDTQQEQQLQQPQPQQQHSTSNHSSNHSSSSSSCSSTSSSSSTITRSPSTSTRKEINHLYRRITTIEDLSNNDNDQGEGEIAFTLPSGNSDSTMDRKNSFSSSSLSSSGLASFPSSSSPTNHHQRSSNSNSTTDIQVLPNQENEENDDDDLSFNNDEIDEDDDDDDDDDLSIDEDLEIILNEHNNKNPTSSMLLHSSSSSSDDNDDQEDKRTRSILNKPIFMFNEVIRRPLLKKKKMTSSSNNINDINNNNNNIDIINDTTNTTNNNTNNNDNLRLSKKEMATLEKLRKQKEAEEELAKRASKRQMTSNQELWNALTMLPTPLYCLYFCLSGAWLTQDTIESYAATSGGAGSAGDFDWTSTTTTTSSLMDTMITDSSSLSSSSCIQSSYLPNLHSIPPYTIIAMTIACVLHSPCSMYYHLLCAYKLPPGPKRMDHWARRLDQAMIHFMSFMIGYATSASTDYFLITMAFNIDCMYRLFQKGMRPKRTLYRMAAAFLIPVLPLVVQQKWIVVLELVIVYSVGGWLFSSYPFGGWSHSAFHLCLFLSNPILMKSSLDLDVDVVKGCMDIAVKCSLMK